MFIFLLLNTVKKISGFRLLMKLNRDRRLCRVTEVEIDIIFRNFCGFSTVVFWFMRLGLSAY